MIHKLEKAVAPYESIDRKTIQSIRNPISLAIWVYLQSKPNNWDVSENEIRNHFNIGRDRYLTAMKELRDLGLYEYINIKDQTGKFVKNIFMLYPVQNNGKPEVRKTVVTENHTAIKETKNINKLERVNPDTENQYSGGVPTSEEQVIAIGKKLGIRKEVCIEFYLYYSAKRWKGILDFVPLLRKWDMSNKKTSSKPAVMFG